MAWQSPLRAPLTQAIRGIMALSAQLVQQPLTSASGRSVAISMNSRRQRASRVPRRDGAHFDFLRAAGGPIEQARAEREDGVSNAGEERCDFFHHDGAGRNVNLS